MGSLRVYVGLIGNLAPLSLGSFELSSSKGCQRGSLMWLCGLLRKHYEGRAYHGVHKGFGLDVEFFATYKSGLGCCTWDLHDKVLTTCS